MKSVYEDDSFERVCRDESLAHFFGDGLLQGIQFSTTQK